MLIALALNECLYIFNIHNYNKCNHIQFVLCVMNLSFASALSYHSILLLFDSNSLLMLWLLLLLLLARQIHFFLLFYVEIQFPCNDFSRLMHTECIQAHFTHIQVGVQAKLNSLFLSCIWGSHQSDWSIAHINSQHIKNTIHLHTIHFRPLLYKIIIVGESERKRNENVR